MSDRKGDGPDEQDRLQPGDTGTNRTGKSSERGAGGRSGRHADPAARGGRGMSSHGPFRKYAYAWITIAFFLVSIAGHWLFGWYAFANEAAEHGQRPELNAYLVEMGRDTFENWQSEFLQLLWQVVGLAYFLYVGSPSSKENDDRAGAKIDALIRLQAGEKAEAIIADIDRRFLRTAGHAMPHGHGEQPAGGAARLAPGEE